MLLAGNSEIWKLCKVKTQRVLAIYVWLKKATEILTDGKLISRAKQPMASNKK
jgi:hypothetical protein